MSEPLLRASRLSKTFPGLKALDEVSLEVHPGEIVAVVGHNGSGKSTLVKILAGVYQPDPGATIELSMRGGLAVGQASHGSAATNLGKLQGSADRESSQAADSAPKLHFIHQDLGLIDMLSAVENLGLHEPEGPRDLAPFRHRKERARAVELIGRFGIRFDPTVPVSQLSPAQRAIVAIARAMDGWTRPDNVLVLDEPTTAFHGNEVEILFEAVRRVAREGAGIIFISHRLDEVLGLADRVIALRDGRVVANQPARELDHEKMVEMIAGRAVAPHQAVRRERGEPVLRVDALNGKVVRDVSFTLEAGEILGVSGVLGSGREELCELLFGAAHRAGGTVKVTDDVLLGDDKAEAIAAGMAFVPADRRRGGAIMEMTVRENLTLPLLRPLRRGFGRLDRRAESREATTWMDTVALRPPNPDQPLKLFSGGNQQKVILAKWLRTRPKVLLLNEPTQGVDVGAKAAIYELIAAAARQGAGVIVCSSETKELVMLCDRVMVLEQGQIRRDLPRSELTEALLVREELGIGAEADMASARREEQRTHA